MALTAAGLPKHNASAAPLNYDPSDLFTLAVPQRIAEYLRGTLPT